MSDINFDELKQIIDTFPELPKRERSMIEIGGCRNDENVNSYYLAFFLRADEEHGLGRLFFDSLLTVIGSNISNFQGQYEVEREFSTKKGNRIDIVIKSISNDWAIIIENKIYHHLNNNLQDYWDSVKVINEDNKKGVILSLRKEHQNYHENFKNITHKKLIKKVKENLGQNITLCNPKFLPFLRDFILNVENYYFYYVNSKIMNINLKAYQDNYQEIQKIEDAKREAILFLRCVIDTKLANIGFVSKNDNSALKRHYYHNGNDKIKEELRFWIDIELLLQNRFLFTLEFKDKSFEEKYKKLLDNDDYKEFKQGLGFESVNHTFFQFVLFNQGRFLNDKDGNDFEKRFKDIINQIEGFLTKKIAIQQ